ncbi:MAG: amidohydrolase family protein [Actinomycetota bacterium]
MSDPTWPTLPPGACDTHLHVYDRRYPSAPGALLHPPDASVDDYRRIQAALGLDRLVLIQPTTYGLDNRLHLEAMATFGDAARGVMVVDADTPVAELRRLTDLGVRGARFHMLPGGAVGWEAIDVVAERVAHLGWHIQLQLNGVELIEHADRLRRLPTPLVVDHIGRFTPPPPVDHPSVRLLLELLEAGRTWVKLSAPYESSASGPPGYVDELPIVDAIRARYSERLLWATNWPHPGQADPPDGRDLLGLLARWLPDDDLRRRVLVDNPTELYFS